MRRRVLVLVSSMNRGGTEMRLRDVLRGLDPRRYEATLGVLHAGELLGHDWPAGVRVRSRLARFRGDPLAPMRLAALFVTDRPDVVWCAGTGILTVLGQIASLVVRVPVVVSVHGLDHPGDRVLSPIGRALAPHATHFLILAEAYRARLLAEGVRSEQVVVQLNGIDTSRGVPLAPAARASARAAHGLPGEGPLLGHVGHMGVRKAQHVLLESFARVRAARPAARLVMVGDGPLRGRLETQARDLGLGESVLMLGPRDDVPDLMPLFDVFVLSSQMEGCPNVAIEAMNAGVPVVATDAGGTREVVSHGETGFVVPTNAPDALAEAVLDLLQDTSRAELMGRRGRERAVALFSMERMLENRMALFDAMVGLARDRT